MVVPPGTGRAQAELQRRRHARMQHVSDEVSARGDALTAAQSEDEEKHDDTVEGTRRALITLTSF